MKHLKIRMLIIWLLAIDLLSKYFFYNQKIFTNFLITPTFNTGVARSLPIPLVIVIIITIAVLIGIYRIFIVFDRQSWQVRLDARTIPTIWEAVSTKEVKWSQHSKTVRWNKKIWRIFLWFFIAGTIGNLIDRVRLWWVRDFININIFNFPIFNIADILLNVWIIWLLIQTFFLERTKK